MSRKSARSRFLPANRPVHTGSSSRSLAHQVFGVPLCARLAGLGALLLTACSEAPPPAVTPPTVLVQAVSPARAHTLQLSGEIRARHEIDLAFRVGGKVIARLVDAGSTVRPGQVLARLDPADLQLAAHSAQAQQAAAESEARTAASEKQRYADLLAKKFVSQAAFDARDNSERTAAARLTQARAQQQLSGNQATYGTLTVEFPAIVTQVLAEAGQVVAAGQPVLRLSRPEDKEVLIAVPENQLAAVKAAQNFTVDVWAMPELALKGELRELAPAADPATRTYAARIRLIHPPASLPLGLTARVRLPDQSEPRAGSATSPLLVPLTAVVDQGQGPVVWVVEAGKARPRPVTLGAYRSDGVLIQQGLQAGDLVVVAGSNKLAPDQAVVPQPLTPPSAQR